MRFREFVWVGGRVTALPSSVGLRSEHPGITRAMGLSMSWDPWPCSVATLILSLAASTRASGTPSSIDPGMSSRLCPALRVFCQVVLNKRDYAVLIEPKQPRDLVLEGGSEPACRRVRPRHRLGPHAILGAPHAQGRVLEVAPGGVEVGRSRRSTCCKRDISARASGNSPRRLWSLPRS